MNKINFSTEPEIIALKQKDGTTMYSIQASNNYEYLEKLALELSLEGKIIKYTEDSNFFFVIGEDTNHYNWPRKLKKLSSREFKKLGLNVRFHRVGEEILLIAYDSKELKQVRQVLKESDFMYKTRKGILNAISVKSQKKSNSAKNKKTNVA